MVYYEIPPVPFLLGEECGTHGTLLGSCFVTVKWKPDTELLNQPAGDNSFAQGPKRVTRPRVREGGQVIAKAISLQQCHTILSWGCAICSPQFSHTDLRGVTPYSFAYVLIGPFVMEPYVTQCSIGRDCHSPFKWRNQSSGRVNSPLEVIGNLAKVGTAVWVS